MARYNSGITIGMTAVGFGLYHVGKSVEMMGDIDSFQGNTAGALASHLTALMLILAAGACFIVALARIVRNWRGGTPPSSEPKAPSSWPDVPLAREKRGDSEPTFDPDAVIARYMAAREAQPGAGASPIPLPASRAFGRKST